MKTLSYTLCAVLAAGFAFTGDAQVKPKSKPRQLPEDQEKQQP